MQVFGHELSQKKHYFTGTHRSRSPAETFKVYSPFMPPMGITRIANVTGLDHVGLPVYQAVRPNARSLSVSQGKGFDRDSAKASALMEAIELWHAERIDKPLRYESYWTLCESSIVVDVTLLPIWAGAQLRLDVPMLWVEGFDLVRNGPAWVPFETVTMNFVSPPGFVPTFVACSNGLASGNHVLEAMVHGLCEVIERDAEAMSSLESRAQLRARRIDLETVDDPCCQVTIERLGRADLQVAVFDVTSETGVPSYTCWILERDDSPESRRVGAFEGSGCHLSPAVALMRALSEAAQSRLTVVTGSRDDILSREYRTRKAADVEALRKFCSTWRPTLSFTSRTDMASPSFEQDLAALIAAVRNLGADSVIAVDLTKPELGIPVVKMIVPGLELGSHPHLGRRCEPGRRAEERLARTRARA